MQDSSRILAKLKAKGHRFARIRKAILDLLIHSLEPLSPSDIQRILSHKKISVHKTSVYRQLAFLKEQNLIRELQFRDKSKRYEIIPDNHHHHIICTRCGKIEDVELSGDLDAEEKMIVVNKNFTVLDHSLEFYGICGKCQDK